MSMKIRKEVFCNSSFPQDLMKEVRITNMLINSKPKGHEVLTQEEVDSIGSRLE
jgi:hypothetical protein